MIIINGIYYGSKRHFNKVVNIKKLWAHNLGYEAPQRAVEKAKRREIIEKIRRLEQEKAGRQGLKADYQGCMFSEIKSMFLETEQEIALLGEKR